MKMMRKLVPGSLLGWLVAQVALPAFAAKRVTVDQLERLVASEHGKSDGKTAQRLYDLELGERLSAMRLANLEAALPGPESRRSLVALADQAAFLDPPAAEIPATTAPDLQAQRQMMARAVDYAANTMHQLPNLFATRDTIRFEDSPAMQESLGDHAVSGTFIPYQPLHPVSRSSATVQYRDGQEVLQADAADKSSSQGLNTSGEFGPILVTVLGDAARGTLTWSHWEQGIAGLQAVFRYSVPRQNSHYQVEFCCIANGLLLQFSGYHGEIAIDPVNGTILRLTLMADLTRSDAIAKAGIMVEYGPVELGDRTYICPLKSVSISLAPAHLIQQMRMPGNAPGSFTQHPTSVQPEAGGTRPPLQIMLNEVVFDRYHLFRADARILTADNAPSAASRPPTPSASTSPSPRQQPSLPIENYAATAPAEIGPAASVAPDLPAPAAPAAAAAPMPPEIGVTETNSLPDTPAAPTASPSGTNLTLHVSTHLVDVGVAAYDKNGHPVTDLKPDDFEILDDGRKQTVRFFTRAGGSGETTANTPGPSGTTPEQFVYSNRLGAVDQGQPSATAAPVEGSSTILLIDASSLDFADLNLARQQMLKFFAGLPPTESVGLYVHIGQGFRVVVEVTRDHAALTSALRQWMPSAQDLAHAQEEEQRNRQQFDEVHNPSDLQYVNGNAAGGGAALPPTMTDPKLKSEGDTPGWQAFTLMVGVAARLAETPGHKNLVWIASDNVLADWTDRAAGSDRGGNAIASFVLRAQEALNDAHVSLYPLDASQLETNAIDPSLKHPSVELEEAVKENTPGASLGDNAPGARPGRIPAEMQQNLHPIQIAIQQMAQATGGRTFRRSDNMVPNLNSVIQDGRAAYLLSFAPNSPPDDQYHQLTVRVATRRGVTLRYRTGYLYAKEPATLKDRFQQAIWQPLDATGIAISARPGAASGGAALTLRIAAADVGLAQQGDLWTDKLDIFLVQRDYAGIHARVKGQTLVLRLKPATYQKLLLDGILFDEFVDEKADAGTLRIVVVDENSGRIGSITLPAAVLRPAAAWNKTGIDHRSRSAAGVDGDRIVALLGGRTGNSETRG
jgi:VWFA-related protein